MSFDLCKLIAIVEEISRGQVGSVSKPPYSWARPGAHPANTYLDNNAVPSNEVGIPFGLNNGFLGELWVGNKNLVEFDITLYYHLGDEIGLTALTTVTVPSTVRTKSFNATDFGLIPIPKDVQLATKISRVPAGKPRSTSVHATVLGTTS